MFKPVVIIVLHPWRQLDQLFEISPVQRQFAHLNLINERTHGRIRCLDLTFHGHGLLRQPTSSEKPTTLWLPTVSVIPS
jgi:hypothetical protein